MVETEELAVREQTAAPQVVVRQVLWDTQVVSRCLSSPQAPQSVWEVVELLVMRVTVVMAAQHLHREPVEAVVVVQEACWGVLLKFLETVQVVAVSGYWVKDRMALVATPEVVAVAAQTAAPETHPLTPGRPAALTAAAAAVVVLWKQEQAPASTPTRTAATAAQVP